MAIMRINEQIRGAIKHIMFDAQNRHGLTVDKTVDIVGWVLTRQLMKNEIDARIDDRVETLNREVQ